MGTRFYVAGAWTEQHRRARPMIARLETAGLVCTCNWTQAEGDVCMCGHHRQQHAPMADIVGATAEAVVPTLVKNCFTALATAWTAVATF